MVSYIMLILLIFPIITPYLSMFIHSLTQEQNKVLICGITYGIHIVIYYYLVAKIQINIHITL